MHFLQEMLIWSFWGAIYIPFLSDCPWLKLGIAIHCIQHSQAMLERGVCELAHSFFHSLLHRKYLLYISMEPSWTRKTFSANRILSWFSIKLMRIIGLFNRHKKIYCNWKKNSFKSSWIIKHEFYLKEYDMHLCES